MSDNENNNNNKELDKQKIIDEINNYPDTILADAADSIVRKPTDFPGLNTNDDRECHYWMDCPNNEFVFSISNYFRQLLSELAVEGKIIIGVGYQVKLNRPESVEEANKIIDNGLGNTIQLFTEESLKRAMCKFA